MTTAEQMKSGAAALRTMAEVLKDNLLVLAEGMEKSTDGQLSGDLEEDKKRAIAADQAGFLCHKLTSACLAFLAGFGDRHLTDEKKVRDFTNECDQNIELLRQQLTSVISNGLQ